MNLKTIVFDVDDTVLITHNRDYANSLPIDEVVQGIRLLKQNGWTIILYTARGMGRSNGNIASVAEQVKKEIEYSCQKYDIPFDELIIGKPLAVAYVDDKAMTPEQFSKNYINFINQ